MGFQNNTKCDHFNNASVTYTYTLINTLDACIS